MIKGNILSYLSKKGVDVDIYEAVSNVCYAVRSWAGSYLIGGEPDSVEESKTSGVFKESFRWTMLSPVGFLRTKCCAGDEMPWYPDCGSCCRIEIDGLMGLLELGVPGLFNPPVLDTRDSVHCFST